MSKLVRSECGSYKISAHRMYVTYIRQYMRSLGPLIYVTVDNKFRLESVGFGCKYFETSKMRRRILIKINN